MIDDDDDSGEPEIIKGDYFVVLFAGLMTIMMTFFIVLCSMSSSSTAKLEQVQQSLDNSFVSLGIVQSSDILWFINNFAQLSKKLKFSKQADVGETTKGKRSKIGFFEKEKERKFKTISDLVIFSSMSINRDNEVVTLTLPGNIFFKGADFVLTAKGEETLQGIKDLMVEEDDAHEILILSYSNNEEVKGNYSALGLCLKRANAVCSFFRKRGVAAKKIKIKALGTLRHRKKAMLRDKIELIIS